jgi:uncharacterized protein
MDEKTYGPLDLLILQGSPFCNIDCNYCYLPNRSDKTMMSLQTIDAIFTKLFQTDIVRRDFTIAWHAGEPLSVSPDFYAQAIDIANNLNNTKYQIRNNIQTNATLITDKWCEFFKERDIKISVSIDGPEFIHDRNRVNRKGEGTFNRVMKGIETLKNHGIPFSVISVVSDFTLDYVDEYYHFFKQLNTKSLGINIEEIENANKDSTLFSNDGGSERFKTFINRLMELYYSEDNEFQIREFGQLESFLITDNKFLEGFGQQTVPYKIIGVDATGKFSTFSPELLNAPSKNYGDFIIGNVYTDNFLDVLDSDKFNRIYSDILKGITMCKQSCKYFSVCGGGTPSNKYTEKGTFVTTETNFCKFKFQSIFDTFITQVESAVLTE